MSTTPPTSAALINQQRVINASRVDKADRVDTADCDFQPSCINYIAYVIHNLLVCERKQRLLHHHHQPQSDSCPQPLGIRDRTPLKTETLQAGEAVAEDECPGICEA